MLSLLICGQFTPSCRPTYDTIATKL